MVKMETKLIIYPNSFLKTVAKPVVNFDSDLSNFCFELLLKMNETNGIGLASVQVGNDQRIIAIDGSKIPDLPNKPFILVNPEIACDHDLDERFKRENKTYKDQFLSEEGCLSLPGASTKVYRFKEILVKYFNTAGTMKVMLAKGPLAVVLQHEIDHLDGKLICDYLPILEKKMFLKKVEKYVKEQKEKSLV